MTKSESAKLGMRDAEMEMQIRVDKELEESRQNATRGRCPRRLWGQSNKW
jgi:hypothetical protein